MKKHLSTILIGATSMVASSPARAQNIVATHDAYGHTIWVASDEAKPQPKPQIQQPAAISAMQSASTLATQPASAPANTSRYSGLVYWSRSEEHTSELQS